MRIFLLVGVGSFLGGMGRHFLQTVLHERGWFPYGTFLVNVAGCFLIGLVFGVTERTVVSHEARLFLTTGLLGGFTTFSAFSHETFALVRGGQPFAAAVYVALSLGIGLLATAGGWALMKN